MIMEPTDKHTHTHTHNAHTRAQKQHRKSEMGQSLNQYFNLFIAIPSHFSRQLDRFAFKHKLTIASCNNFCLVIHVRHHSGWMSDGTLEMKYGHAHFVSDDTKCAWKVVGCRLAVNGLAVKCRIEMKLSYQVDQNKCSVSFFAFIQLLVYYYRYCYFACCALNLVFCIFIEWRALNSFRFFSFG